MIQIVQALALVTSIKQGSLPTTPADDSHIQIILSIVFGIVGALALLMLTISGLRFIISGGDPQRAAKARNGIIYSLAGLAVAVAAQAIVIFVVRRV